MRAMIASGSGRYADPWHPFSRTSPLVADILHTVGFDVSTEDDVDVAMRSLDGVDLVVVNAGDPWSDAAASTPPPASIDGLAEALERGIGVLALHCAVASLRDYPGWAAAVGAVWLPELSFHPPFGRMEVTGVPARRGATVEGGTVESGRVDDSPSHDVTVAGVPVLDFDVTDFTLDDERYCRLQRIGTSTVVAQHEGTGAAEPTAWIRPVGPSRVAVDVLGHDERSYESAGHRRLIQQLAGWACRTAG